MVTLCIFYSFASLIIYQFIVFFLCMCAFSFALVTFTAAIEFIRKDELSLQQPFLVPPPKHVTPYGYPKHNASWSSLPNHYRSTSLPDRNFPESPSNPMHNVPTTLPVVKSVSHRKSKSTDLGLNKIQPPPEDNSLTRRKSISPSVTIKPQIVVPSIKESKPKFLRNASFDQTKIPRQEEPPYTDSSVGGDGKPMISTTSPTISSSTPISKSKSKSYFFSDQAVSSVVEPTAPRLERSLSSVSSRSMPSTRTRSPGMHHQAPEIIRVSFDHSTSRPGSTPAGINRRPVSMYSSEQFNDSELMGDFLAGLQNNSDYVGDRAGRIRRVSGRW